MASNSGGPIASAPAFVLLLGLCTAIWSGYCGLPAVAAIIIALMAASAWVLLGSRRLVAGLAAEFLLILLLVAAGSMWSLHSMSSANAFPSSLDTEARVLQSRKWGRSTALLLDTKYGRLVTYISRNNIAEGSLVRVRGAVFDLAAAKKERGFNEFLFWRARGAQKKLVTFAIKATEPPSGLPKWRIALSKRINAVLPERMAGYMLALTVGARDEKLTETHRSTGTLHLLAVSGFHVAIAAGLAMLFFRRGILRIVGVSVAVWFYVLFAGAPAGGLRAALMLQIFLLGLAVGRPSNGFNSVSAAGVLLLIWNPWYLFDVGWQLSMSAALFISAAASLAKNTWRSAAAVSMLVWLVTAPIVAYYFDKLPLAGLFVNVLAVPLFSVIFPAVLICSAPLLLGFCWFSFAAVVCEYFLESWDIFAEIISGLLPWQIGFTFSLMITGILVFLAAAAAACGFFEIKNGKLASDM